MRQVLEAGSIPDPRREAEELYAALVCGATSRAFLDRDLPLSAAPRAKLELAAQRRAAGWPQQYAIGRANFRGHWLTVDPRVLIPRPETEGLVELVLDWAVGRTGGLADGNGGAVRPPDRPSARPPVVADIGTGSGAIAIALALEAPVAGVIATDISGDALNVAIENAAQLGAKDRISFRKGPLCLPLLGDVVDAVVSNPPYVATEEWEALAPGVKDYEPRQALDGGADGQDVIRALVVEAFDALAGDGLLALEVDARRAEGSAALARGAGFERVEVRNDLFGRPRYVRGRRPER